MKHKATVLFLSFALLVTNANAGAVTKAKEAAVAGTVVVVGLGAWNLLKKKCHTEIDPETGLKNKLICGHGTPSLETPDEDDGSNEFGLLTERTNTTKELRKALNAEIRSATPSGMPPPEDPDGCEAHHIVPQSENRAWAKSYADKARLALDRCVDIDSAQNGIYLPSKSQASCQGSNHKKVHTRNYYNDLANRLEDAKTINGCAGVQDELEIIKSELSAGKLW